MAKTPEEKKQELLQKKAQIEARLKALDARAKEAERKARTKRLIDIGAAVEHHAGTITDLAAFNKYLEQYGGYIAKTQQAAGKKEAQ